MLEHYGEWPRSGESAGEPEGRKNAVSTKYGRLGHRLLQEGVHEGVIQFFGSHGGGRACFIRNFGVCARLQKLFCEHESAGRYCHEQRRFSVTALHI
jgi:hypothetical protein